MAITNAQQYQQLVNKPASGKRPGYRGIGGYQSGKSAPSSSSRSVSPGGGNSRRSSSPSNSSDGPDRSKVSDLQQYNHNVAMGITNPQGPPMLNEREKALLTFQATRPEVKTFGLSSLFKKPLQMVSDFTTAKNRKFFQDVIRAGKFDYKTKDGKPLGFDMTEDELEDAYQNYMSSRLSGEIDAYGNPLNQGDGDGQEILIPQFVAQAPVTEEPEVDPDSLQGMLANRTAYRFMADGGMTNDAPVEGGIMDLESGRQMYFLGKLVKKATRAVKKIVKSPIGKAALAFGAYKFGPGIGDFLKNKALDFGLYEAGKGLTGKGMLGLGAALTAAPLLFQEEEEEQPDYASNRGPGLDINAIRANPYNTMGQSYRFYAEGGDVEPVAKKTMPLLDMDGKEMDLRKDGGFVPIGRMERADDVPARLSKNEFVFTADAVRNAGDGDIDKGAEVMYNMMKNLESGGEVSEESQGLDGAREMFQTSKRLEEVL